MIILSIETSCDDTSFAIGSFDNGSMRLLANSVSSQTEIHKEYGGVVPNLSAREHLQNYRPILMETLERANTTLADINCISVTAGPGLIPSLLVGATVAKTLAYALQKPLVPIHHVEGHIYSNWLAENSVPLAEKIPFPLLALVVSGGHTQLIYMKEHLCYEIIGETLDDACGEAYDKVARMLGIGYPGGPAVSKLAENGNPKAFAFPRPMSHSADFNFSFSGLKTAVLYAIKKQDTGRPLDRKFMADIAASFQSAVIDILAKKTEAAVEERRPKSLLLCGGVSANKALRQTFSQIMPGSVFMPEQIYTGDNAAMILPPTYLRLKRFSLNHYRHGWRTLIPSADLPLQVS